MKENSSEPSFRMVAFSARMRKPNGKNGKQSGTKTRSSSIKQTKTTGSHNWMPVWAKLWRRRNWREWGANLWQRWPSLYVNKFCGLIGFNGFGSEHIFSSSIPRFMGIWIIPDLIWFVGIWRWSERKNKWRFEILAKFAYLLASWPDLKILRQV